jgi:polysaccharide pyruvyl transferase WcaK-like protein
MNAGDKSYRVELAYRFKRKKTGVLLGMTVKAENDDAAIDQAIAQHIDPYPSRVLIQCTAEES